MFRCKSCEELRRHNEWLRKLLDSFLIKFNMPPIEEDEEVREEVAVEDIDKEVYGG